MESEVVWEPDFDRIATHIDTTDDEGVVSMYSPGESKFIIYKNSSCARGTFEEVIREAVETAPESKHTVAFAETDALFGSYQAVVRLDPSELQ